MSISFKVLSAYFAEALTKISLAAGIQPKAALGTNSFQLWVISNFCKESWCTTDHFSDAFGFLMHNLADTLLSFVPQHNFLKAGLFFGLEIPKWEHCVQWRHKHDSFSFTRLGCLSVLHHRSTWVAVILLPYMLNMDLRGGFTPSSTLWPKFIQLLPLWARKKAPKPPFHNLGYSRGLDQFRDL